MMTLAIGDNRDLHLNTAGNMATATGQEAAAQYLRQRLSTLTGELQLDKSAGVPYMQTVFERGVKGVPSLRSAILASLAEVPFVIGVSSLRVEFIGVELRFEVRVSTDFGIISVSNIE